MKRGMLKTHQMVWQPGERSAHSVEDGRAELRIGKTGWKVCNAGGEDPTAQKRSWWNTKRGPLAEEWCQACCLRTFPRTGGPQ